MGFTPSKYQQRIYDFIEKGSGNAVINAVAGSGKTTTLISLLERVPSTSRVLFLAFNKSIVEELKIKTSRFSNVDVRTLHSLGCSALRKQLSIGDINSSKYRQYVTEQLKSGAYAPTRELSLEEKSEYRSNVLDLIDLARVNLCQSAQEVAAVAQKHGLFLHDNEIQLALNAIVWGRSESGLSTIDFTDMIYLPCYFSEVRFFKYDLVLIDECQDLNAAQRTLFLKTIKRNGRFVAVGDPRQAIYGFAGADVESFNLLKSLPDTVELPLSVCYRCDREMIKRAQAEVPQIEWREGAPDGIVNDEAKVADIKDGDMVLCRLSAPLVALCIKWIGEGVKAYIKGRDIGTNLVNMLQKTKRVRIKDALKVLEKELARVQAEIVKTTGMSLEEAVQHTSYVLYADKIKAIEVISEGLTKVEEVCDRINAIFSDESKQGICLSTVHKSKGLEADRVFILCPDKFLLKRSMKISWMAEQEHNLIYVAYTRAKHYLGFVTDFKI